MSQSQLQKQVFKALSPAMIMSDYDYFYLSSLLDAGICLLENIGALFCSHQCT